MCVDPCPCFVFNLIVSSFLVCDPPACSSLWLIHRAPWAMMDKLGLHGWSSLIIGMLQSVKQWILIIPFMSDTGPWAYPSAETLIWWSNGSINSTLIPSCEDIELNQTPDQEEPFAVKLGRWLTTSGVISEKLKAIGVPTCQPNWIEMQMQINIGLWE